MSGPGRGAAESGVEGMDLSGFLPGLVLAAALTTDSFVAGLGLGAQEIRVPFFSALIVSVMGTGCLAASLLLGDLLEPVLSQSAAKTVSFLLLFGLGAFKFFESTLKIALRRHGGRGSVRFTALGLQFLLAVYACPEEADADHSKRLGALEAVSLGVGLSVDSLAAGLGAGLGSVAILPTLAASLLLGMGMLAAGSACARWAASRLPVDLSPVGGVLLIALAVLRL